MISQKDRKMYKDYAQDYNQELANEFWHLALAAKSRRQGNLESAKMHLRLMRGIKPRLP